MLDFARLTINDRGLFDRHLKRYGPQASELTFTNLFMWRNCDDMRYAEIDALLCIICVPQEGTPYAYMPVGEMNDHSLTAAIYSLKEYFRKKGWQLVFKRITEGELEHFRKFGISDRYIEYDRDNSDYLYLTKDLISLTGKKYDGKRNHIKRFRREYTYEYVSMEGRHAGECRRIMEEWCARRNCLEHKELYCEKLAVNELMYNFGKLGCRGALIKVNGRYEAFTIGEMLNEDTVVIHMEKADSRINGLYTFINQQFCEREWGGTAYVNREQDLGLESIRKAKLSYHPARMVNKHNVFIP